MNHELIATDVALACPSGRQLSRISPVAAGFLCDKYVVLEDHIKYTISAYP
jgi:hypothetical protein